MLFRKKKKTHAKKQNFRITTSWARAKRVCANTVLHLLAELHCEGVREGDRAGGQENAKWAP